MHHLATSMSKISFPIPILVSVKNYNVSPDAVKMEGRTDEQTDIVKLICAPYIAFLMKEVSLMNNSVKKLLKSDHK